MAENEALALDLLQEFVAIYGAMEDGDGEPCPTVAKARALLAALAAEKQEPVAWVIPGDDNCDRDGFIDARVTRDGEFTRPLYTTPPSSADLAAAYRKEGGELVAVKPHGVVLATVREGDDEWHIECRFADGQKYAAVKVAIEQEALADFIAAEGKP